ncbi:hypothetical protein M2163_000617 [Streptomyces sp. SAI-135]|uniref:hypothetical protein n=1 Tax=unclassified Streptomyces TaxID=2593676 RepID=UPI00247644F8|nr:MULTISPECIES: hypothetical protein [unclassified Streptomyces]MDH6522876.1 hypothetical protein [Streptomyces sp. SAI-090]MDH6613509.1 hypothetical protein [Streptomyces sp. SAI-135]
MIRGLPEPEIGEVEILGTDDFDFRKGRRLAERPAGAKGGPSHRDVRPEVVQPSKLLGTGRRPLR